MIKKLLARLNKGVYYKWNEERQCAGFRLVHVHPMEWAELGFKLHLSRESFGVRIQLLRYELMAHVQYGLYGHQKPGHPSYEYWESINKAAAERKRKFDELLAQAPGGWDAPIKQEVKFRRPDDADIIDYRE